MPIEFAPIHFSFSFYSVLIIRFVYTHCSMFSHASLVLCGLLLCSVEISNNVNKGALHNAGMGEVFSTPYTHQTTPITARLYLVNFTSKALLWLTIKDSWLQLRLFFFYIKIKNLQILHLHSTVPSIVKKDFRSPSLHYGWHSQLKLIFRIQTSFVILSVILVTHTVQFLL